MMQGRRFRRIYLVPIFAALAAIVALIIADRVRGGHLGLALMAGIFFFLVVAVVAAGVGFIALRRRTGSIRKSGESIAVLSAGTVTNASSTLSIIASVVAIVASLVAIFSGHDGPNPTPSPTDTRSAGSHSVVSCFTPLGGPPRRAFLSSSQYQGSVFVRDVSYSLYSGDKDRKTAQLYDAMYGRMMGHLPRGKVIYSVGFWHLDPKSIQGKHGWPRYFPGGELRPGKGGCWSFPSRAVGQPGSVGLHETIYFMLSSLRAAHVFEHEEQIEDQGHGSGLTQATIDSLHVIPMYTFQLDTETYDVVKSS